MNKTSAIPKFDVLASNSKLDKAHKLGYLQIGLSLAPADLSGRNVCAHSSAGCREACLFSAGRGAMPNVIAARIQRTNDLFADREVYMGRINADIIKAKAYCSKNGLKLCIRLNVLSDLVWEGARFKIEGKTLFETHPEIQFLDYTKNPARMMKFIEGGMPANYHLTFSQSEENAEDCQKVLAAGGNVATVFAPLDRKAKRRTFEFPKVWGGHKVFNGDDTDLRFLDPKGRIIGLRGKGRAFKDQSGFVTWF